MSNKTTEKAWIVSCKNGEDLTEIGTPIVLAPTRSQAISDVLGQEPDYKWREVKARRVEVGFRHSWFGTGQKTFGTVIWTRYPSSKAMC